jgi:hypothetical protein
VLECNFEHKFGDNMKTKLLFLTTTVLLGACGSNPVVDYQQAQEKQARNKVERMTETLNDVPEWFLTPPISDATGVYATATASSSDLQYARELAIFQAEYSIAKTINNEVSGKERLHRSQSAGGFKSTADQTVVKRVAGADVLGYRIVSQEYRIQNGQYASYVLLHMPYEMQQQMIENRDNNFQKAAETQYNDVETFSAVGVK